MIETIITAALLGLFAGAVPGPFTTVVAGTALERGFTSAWKLAFIPLVTEVPALLVTVLLLKNLNHDLLGAVGVGGGIVVIYLGARFVRRKDPPVRAFDEIDRDWDEWKLFRTLAAAGLLSPAPWIFWLVAAGPLFLRAWNLSWVHGLVYVVVLLSMFIGTATGIAWLASHGRKIMGPARRSRVIQVVGIVLVVAGGVLVWQSAVGNFQAIVERQEALRESVQ